MNSTLGEILDGMILPVYIQLALVPDTSSNYLIRVDYIAGNDVGVSSTDGITWIIPLDCMDYILNPNYERHNMKVKTDNPVEHPSHYNQGKIEVIDAIEDWKLDFHRGNAIKYIVRAGLKDPDMHSTDIDKAIWYLKRYRATLK